MLADRCSRPPAAVDRALAVAGAAAHRGKVQGERSSNRSVVAFRADDGQVRVNLTGAPVDLRADRRLPRRPPSSSRFYQYEGIGNVPGGAITGSPVSPGVVEGPVRVVFDPQATQLLSGEILVCPGTDPAWTPLFLVAGGLVTEVGGMMTHGSVVAREYGIPAVVGVHDATTLLATGQRIRLDGTAGSIEILAEEPAAG